MTAEDSERRRRRPCIWPWFVFSVVAYVIVWSISDAQGLPSAIGAGLGAAFIAGVCPDFPARFTSIEHARSHGRQFFTWYNTEHRHSGIGMLTPADVHQGRVGEVQARRCATLATAYAEHPERFARHPRPPAPPSTAYINRPPVDSTNQATT